jgi:FixJ family two-component response regulator
VTCSQRRECRPVVYVVDDDESMRTALGRLLRSADFAAEPAVSALSQRFLNHERIPCSRDLKTP